MRVFRRTLISLGILSCLFQGLDAQISNSLYFMYGVPQSNRINPALQPKCGFYLGFPLLAPLRMEVASSSLAYKDIIYPHPSEDSLILFLHPLADKEAFLARLQPVNFLASDLGTSLASFGFRTAAGFFSVDLTMRVDGSFYYPRDLFRFIFSGPDEGEVFEFDGLGIDFSVINEFAMGWSASITENLQVGARGKIMFGIADISTRESEMTLSSSRDSWLIRSNMILNASMPFARVNYDGEGLIEDVQIDEDLENADPFSIPGYLFNFRNLGVGADLGINYRPIEPLQLSLSAVDLGFISWNDGVHRAEYDTEYEHTPFELDPFEFSEEYSFGEFLDSAISRIGDSLFNSLHFTENDSYTRRLNARFYAGASVYLTPNINFGLLSRTAFLNRKVTQQFTASANFTTGRFINLTLSYSYMNNYLKNMGGGLAFNVGPLNLYLISDNALNLVFWPHESRSVNLWFGMNLVFGYRQFKYPGTRDRPMIY
ncbi:MAG: hypothetical protein EHM46_00110 [Bacteroidetes bacterium]|nr:MAG: hypothetical protein EHM46_00110 [Bacteroidota bacterium]